jgi:hypothetical protein
MNHLSVEDIAAMREQGDLEGFLRGLTGRPTKPKPTPLAAAPDPGYRVAHVGGWPLGSAASGPTPPPDACTCAKCGGNPASRTTHQSQQGEAA